MAAGQAHSAFVSEDGALFTCGACANGRLGVHATHPPTVSEGGARSVADAATSAPRRMCPLPARVLLPEGVCAAQVAAGIDHTVVRSRDGRILTFGRGQAGQLGTGDRKDRAAAFELPMPPPTAAEDAEDAATAATAALSAPRDEEDAATPTGCSRGPGGARARGGGGVESGSAPQPTCRVCSRW